MKGEKSNPILLLANPQPHHFMDWATKAPNLTSSPYITSGISKPFPTSTHKCREALKYTNKQTNLQSLNQSRKTYTNYLPGSIFTPRSSLAQVTFQPL